MKVLVCGASGCVGRAVVQALRVHGHTVVEGVRRAVSAADPESALEFDFMQPVAPEAWATRLAPLALDAVVNAVGILIESGAASFERLHAAGPIELFRGAGRAGVRRIVQVSALGVTDEAGAAAPPYLSTKAAADRALRALGTTHERRTAGESASGDPDGIDGLGVAVVRPSLVTGPGSASARLFATLAALPVLSLPGGGRQRLQPVHVFELAEAIARLVESHAQGVFEIGGGATVTYRGMLEAYRRAQGLGPAIALPVPMPLVRWGAALAEALPQSVASRDTIRLLERGNTTDRNALPELLGRAPATLDEALAASPPRPALDLRVTLPPLVEACLRAALAFLWLQTALVSALWPHDSGVLDLLARCGFPGAAGRAMLVASCTLNTTLGVLTLLRADVRLFALQAGAVVGYTAVAAWNVPSLTIDHCAPLAKNVPLLGLVLVLWLAAASRSQSVVPQTSMLATRRALPSMKSRRGSTSSPISIVKTRSASIASSS